MGAGYSTLVRIRRVFRRKRERRLAGTLVGDGLIMWKFSRLTRIGRVPPAIRAWDPVRRATSIAWNCGADVTFFLFYIFFPALDGHACQPRTCVPGTLTWSALSKWFAADYDRCRCTTGATGGSARGRSICYQFITHDQQQHYYHIVSRAWIWKKKNISLFKIKTFSKTIIRFTLYYNMLCSVKLSNDHQRPLEWGEGVILNCSVLLKL